jgi:hypothetical protein
MTSKFKIPAVKTNLESERVENLGKVDSVAGLDLSVSEDFKPFQSTFANISQ